MCVGYDAALSLSLEWEVLAGHGAWTLWHWGSEWVGTKHNRKVNTD